MNQKDVERAIEIMQYNLDDPILFKGENVTKAIKIAIACMDLQVGKKPDIGEGGAVCPMCRKGVCYRGELFLIHCACGQRILWEAER